MKKKVEYFRETDEIEESHVEVTVPSVNIREKPSYKGAIIGTATDGEKLKYRSTIIDPDGVSWYGIVYGDNSGWVCGNYSRLVE